MKFYIENHEGKQVFEGTQVECEAEMNRLVLSGEEGYWRMFDETDHDEAWQEGGLVELAASQQGVQSDGELPCPTCKGEVGHRINCPHGIAFTSVPRR